MEGKMKARLKAQLSREEDRTLFEVRTATHLPQRVRDRAEVIRLSHQGWFVEKIADFFGWRIQTVRETLHRWEHGGLGGLWDAPHPGKQPRWVRADIEYLEECLRQEPRSYNSHQLAQKLLEERQVKLSPGHLRDVLKKRGSFGNAPVKATTPNKTLSPNKLSKTI
jgi:transposase